MDTASTLSGFLIRDGLDSDIDSCLSIDHRYETERVWQMNIYEGVGERQVTFKTEHLPRRMEVTYPADERRLRLALPDDQCFLVATTREPEELLGYLTMTSIQPHRIALIQDIVIALPYRRHRIGTRLLNVARKWAREHGLTQITIETQTKNYPAILFCQQAGLTFCGFNDHYFPNQDIAVFFSQSLR